MPTFSNNFDIVKVSATNIDWDIDPEDVDAENGEPELPAAVDYEFDKKTLIDEGILCEDFDTGDLLLNEEALSEYVGNRLTNDYEFCHNGFGMTYSMKRLVK